MQTKKANWFMLLVTVLPFAYQLIFSMVPLQLPLWLRLMMGELLILVSILIYCAMTRKESFWKRIPHEKLGIRVMLLIVLYTLLTSPLMAVCNLLSQFLVRNTAVQVMDVAGGLPFAVLFFAIAILPPIVEELGFRGIMLQNYRESGVWSGILLSALLFGLMHMNLNQMLYAFVLGILMALLVEATNSIFSSMLMHFLINGSNVLMMYSSFQAAEGSTQELYDASLAELGISHEMFLVVAVLMFLIFAVAGIALAVPVYKKIASLSGREGYIRALFKGNVQPSRKDRRMTIPLILAIVCSVAYIVFDTLVQMGIIRL